MYVTQSLMVIHTRYNCDRSVSKKKLSLGGDTPMYQIWYFMSSNKEIKVCTWICTGSVFLNKKLKPYLIWICFYDERYFFLDRYHCRFFVMLQWGWSFWVRFLTVIGWRNIGLKNNTKMTLFKPETSELEWTDISIFSFLGCVKILITSS